MLSCRNPAAPRNVAKGGTTDRSAPHQQGNEELIQLLLGSGESYLERGDTELAHRCASRALELAGSAGSPALTGRALVIQARTHLALGEPDAARACIDPSLPLIEAMPDPLAAANALCDVAEVARACDDPELARRLLLESLRRSSGAAPAAERARALEALGMLDRAAARYEEALNCFLEAFRIVEGLDDRPAQGRHLNRIGNLLQKMGRPTEALDHQRRALRIWEGLNSRLEIGKASNNIGGALLDQGDYEAAAACFERARAVFQDLGERAMLAHVLSNLGLLNDYKGEMRTAEALLRESLEIREGLGDRSGQANCLNNLAHVALSAGRYEDAIAWTSRSIAIREELKQQEGLAKPWINLAQACIELSRFAEAEEAGRKVREIAERSASLETHVESLVLEARLALRREGPALAVETASRASEIAAREGYRQPRGQAQQILGEARLALEDYDGARESLLEAEAIFRDLRVPLLLAYSRLCLGQLFHRIGSDEAAAERFRRAAEAFDRMGNQAARWHALIGLAEAESSLSPGQAEASLEAAHRIAVELGRADLVERSEGTRKLFADRRIPERGTEHAAEMIRSLSATLRERLPAALRLEAFLRKLADGLALEFVLLRTTDGAETSRGSIPAEAREIAGRGAADLERDAREARAGDPHAPDDRIVPAALLDRGGHPAGVLVAGWIADSGRASLLAAAADVLGFWLAAGEAEPRSPDRPAPARRSRFERLVGASPPMLELYDAIEKVAPTDASVLIQGESGTGKELVAQAIHARSRRAAAAFVAISCPSIPRELIEAELFGHERGAFTGAHTARLGRIDAADRGTLFLDEIGDMAQATQSKLLRFLQEREFQRVGGRASIRVDVRLVAATSRDLDTEIREGRFREDLYYRINVVPLRLPPLRDRIEDLSQLLEHFLHDMDAKQGKPASVVSEEALAILGAYSWPGNIRELRNTTEYLVAMGQGGRIEAEHIPERIRSEAARAMALRSRESGRTSGASLLRSGETLDARLLSLEGEMIREALERSRWNQSQAARMLGITETRMRHRMRRYGLRGRTDEEAPERRDRPRRRKRKDARASGKRKAGGESP